MPIVYATGDATRPIGDGNKIIVHVCNDVGAWGAGFVLAVSARWPGPEDAYRKWCECACPPQLGDVQMCKVESDIWVANIIGQHGVGPSLGRPPIRYDAIRKGLREVSKAAANGKASIHMPRIGCGLAGGRWEEVEPIIQDEMPALSVVVYDLPQKRKPK